MSSARDPHPASSLIPLALVLLVACLYLLTYRANLSINDELQMFDVTGSLAQFGDFRYDLSNWFRTRVMDDPALRYPLAETEIDRFQMIAAAPLYALVERLPGVGLVHGVWLFNVLISTGIALLFYRYALLLGYSQRTAAWAALLLVTSTALWLYAQTFFREPLAMFWLLLAAYALEQVRRGLPARRPSLFLWGLLAVLALALMTWTKQSLLAALPGLLLLALPHTKNRWFRRMTQAALLMLLAGAVLAAFTPLIDTLFPAGDLSFMGYTVDTSVTQAALHSYLFSIGASLWGTSPVLLLAIPGGWLLIRQGESQRVLAVLVLLLGVALAYALLRGEAWFGSTWPPRFLLPVLPVVFALALPTLESLVAGRSSFVWRAAALLVITYALWWQASAVFIDKDAYLVALPPESGGLVEWGPGQNLVAYLRPVVLTQVLMDGGEPLDTLWARTGRGGWMLVFAGLALASMGLLLRSLRAPTAFQRRGWRLLWVAPLILGLLVFVALRDAYHDPRYLGTDPAMHELLAVIDAEEAPYDIVVIGNQFYHEFFLNYGRVDHARFVALGFHPGERGSFEQQPAVVSDVPDELLSERSPETLYTLIAARDHLWLVMETGPFLPWSVRPVERFMTLRAYPLREIAVAPTARLLEYAATPAPDPFAAPPPQTPAGLVFEDVVRLEGLILPDGERYAPGDPLPVTLLWSASVPLEVDVTVAFFLVNGAGQVIAQGQDSQPQGGFAPSSAWSPGATIYDNRALRVPPDTPPGDYALWLRLYTFDEAGAIVTLSAAGGEVTGDADDIAVLPVTIRVE